MRHAGGRPEAQERRSHGAGEGTAPTQVKGRGAAPALGEARRRKEEGGATETRERGGTVETSDAVARREIGRDGEIFFCMTIHLLTRGTVQ